MKMALIALSLLLTSFASAGEVFSTRIVSTDVQSLPLPEDLHFHASKIHVKDPTWYTSIFEESGCELSLSERDLNSPIEIKASGPHQLELSLNHHWSPALHTAYANYVPLYYNRGVPVHPHFLIKIKGWVMLHATIHRMGEKKMLKLSLVQGRGDNIHLVPILEAEGE